MLASVDENDLKHALGGVVLEAAHLERALRAALSALVGSKYATVVAGHLTEAALIEDCRKITEYHTGPTEPVKQTVLSALAACDAARRKRNRIMHDVAVSARATDEVHRVADQLAGAAGSLNAAMTAAFGPTWARTEDQLREELGHDISTDPGS
jgi:hypothetical protein